MSGIATIHDVKAIEAAGLPDLPPSTYDLIRRGAAMDPDAPALSFFLAVEEHRRPETWTYRELVARVTQTANFFHRLGATKQTVIAFVLPDLPESHAVIWGGEAAGVVLALNPLLEGAALGALLESAGAEILVTLAPFPGTDLWQKLQPTLARLSRLRHVVLIDLARRPVAIAGGVPEHIAVHDFAASIREEESGSLVSRRRFSPSDRSWWFCTGGTTGLPRSSGSYA